MFGKSKSMKKNKETIVHKRRKSRFLKTKRAKRQKIVKSKIEPFFL